MLTVTDDIRTRYQDDLRSMVGLATVSADPASKANIDQIVQLAVSLLERSGLKAEILPTVGYPLVYGEYIGDPAWATVLIYNHLDVQPADPGEWRTDPFQLAIRDHVFYGRGTTDDKGPLLSALFALEHVIRRKVPLNFKVLWETEEEIGSTHFAAAAHAIADRLKGVDSVLVSDTMWTAAGKPAIIYGLRGLLGFELSLQTGKKDVHSGSCGGVAVNPINELARVIAALTDSQTGRVAVPGFYDGTAPPTSGEITQFMASGFSLEDFKADNELLVISKDNPEAAVTAIMAEPTLDINGISSGHIGERDVKTIIPYRAVAQGSARLVPGQTPEGVFRVIETFVSRLSPMVETKMLAGAPPYISDVHGHHAEALAAAYTEDVGLKPAFVREGGSIGAVLTLAELTKAPIMLAGLSLPTDGYHSKNECFEWRQATRGMQLFSSYFERIARIAKGRA